MESGCNGSMRLTSHEKIEAIANVALVAREVDATVFLCFLHFIGAEFRTERDTTAEDYAGIFFFGIRVGLFITILILQNRFYTSLERICEHAGFQVFLGTYVALVVGSRAHFPRMSGERTPQDTLLGSEVKVIPERKAGIVMVRGEGDRRSYGLSECCQSGKETRLQTALPSAHHMGC